MMEKLGPGTNALNWFEISVNDIDRAASFYETIFDVSLMRMEMMGMKMAAFPSEPPHSGGALVQSKEHKPSMDGAVIYLNANPDLQLVLDRVSSAGGQIILGKTLIDDQVGYMAFIIDTEGNKVGLHSGHQ
jgi:predicted enzyme related to lactoylglutathione lyase